MAVPRCPSCPHAIHEATCNAIVEGRSCGCTTITLRRTRTLISESIGVAQMRRLTAALEGNTRELELPNAALRLIEARIAKIEGELRNLKTWIEEQKDLVRRQRELEEKAQREREAEEKERADRLRQQEAGGFSELDLGPLTKRD